MNAIAGGQYYRHLHGAHGRDENSDPVGESARAILDGHIVLSRELAEQGHFPAIDIEASISRSMSAVTRLITSSRHSVSGATTLNIRKTRTSSVLAPTPRAATSSSPGYRSSSVDGRVSSQDTQTPVDFAASRQALDMLLPDAMQRVDTVADSTSSALV